MKRMWWLGLAVLAACEGDGGAGADGCRADRECGGNEFCEGAVLPDDPVCGVPCQSMKTCAGDGDCSGGGVCVEYVGPCCRDGEGTNTSCQLTCTDDAACGKDRRCRADGRGCEAVPCDDGFTCPVETRCDRASAAFQGRLVDPLFTPLRHHELDHGCVRLGCVHDSDCDGGVCVAELCQETAGVCEEIVIVP